MRGKIITLFVCIAIGIGAMVVIKYYIDDDQCIAVAKYSRGIIVDQNNEPISNVKIYEDSIESEIPHGVCGEIALQVVTPDGGIYTRKYDSEHIPKVIKIEYKK